ncbi:hypothetical protein CO115_03295 [Candidatus Falkowbacteria bacterium CG_4_9_14_3_um_filter_36_9]|uniref:Uncharacterized protein n=1 Tax=Candidatus Falkowbacteria bacterium CG02_land_8_20_14_3_00_36_14 TaxID=1974560 RepID=A0A2M7DNK3_9BACT|nr:MAG: hypothetical protein COS18_02980 [Candidatus Falkowbacteria bacterium CG02_land_8_20_14_3_00_36_14]PIX11917.1 MAG: hypothetical protein COZ73_01470 [Candidatus Falkowbacteria bacterium CG_4_8_14_3_um_filter_36_11]PJB19064.1 MAG: hypothetical protein CO115_03295 [Candidatus Falkowbacteria bacterium CG_4_9_14_3_um_filter_36_9]
MENNDNTQNSATEVEEVLDYKAYMEEQISQIFGDCHVYFYGIDLNTDGRKASPILLFKHWNRCGAGERFRNENLKNFYVK